MQSMTPRQLQDRLNSAEPPHLLDVREVEEHQIVHLPGARLLPLGELLLRSEELEDWKDEEVVVYCHHGIRSMHAIAQLQHLGFTRLFNLTGGIDRYSEQVNPLLPRY